MRKRLFAVMLLVVGILISGCQGQVEDSENQSTGLNYSIEENANFRAISEDGYEDIKEDDEIIAKAIESSVDWFEETYSFDYKNIDLEEYEGDELKKYQTMVDGELVVAITSLQINHSSRYEKDGVGYVAFNYHVVSVMEGGSDIYFAELSRKNSKNITRGYEKEAYGIAVMKNDGEGYVIENSAHVSAETFNNPHVPEMMFGK